MMMLLIIIKQQLLVFSGNGVPTCVMVLANLVSNKGSSPHPILFTRTHACVPPPMHYTCMHTPTQRLNYLLKQCLMQQKLALNLLYKPGWP